MILFLSAGFCSFNCIQIVPIEHIKKKVVVLLQLHSEPTPSFHTQILLNIHLQKRQIFQKQNGILLCLVSRAQGHAQQSSAISIRGLKIKYGKTD